MDISHTVIPKSDQLNSDDLIAGPRTITITKVTANESSAEQPVNVYFDGDDGKPYRPCKSMRRVMISAWGADAKQYAGRSMTIYRDASVTWGGMEVGGIRISHMSHLDREMVMALTATKKARKPYRVLPLKADAPPPAVADKARAMFDTLCGRIRDAADLAALEALTADAKVRDQRAWLERNKPGWAEDVAQEVNARLAALSPPAEDPPEPGDADALGLPE